MVLERHLFDKAMAAEAARAGAEIMLKCSATDVIMDKGQGHRHQGQTRWASRSSSPPDASSPLTVTNPRSPDGQASRPP